jgi:hypothetical protein
MSFQEGEQVLLIDGRGKRHLIFLRKSETFHSDRGWIPHDALVGQPEGSWVRSPLGMRCLAVRPTLAEYVLEMPRGAQVIYPKDLAVSCSGPISSNSTTSSDCAATRSTWCPRFIPVRRCLRGMRRHLRTRDLDPIRVG